MPVITRQIGPCLAADGEGVDLTRPLSPGDNLVMWDTRQTMHRARPFPAHEPRDMRRTTLAGDGPTVAQVA